MKLSKRTNLVIMWILAIGLLVGMIVTFTPTVGTLFGDRQDTLETPVVTVNNQAITDQQVALVMQRNPVYASVQEGEVAEDLRLLLIDQLIDNELIRQAAARERVSRAEVREAVNEFRREAGVAGRQNDQAYLALIGRQGHTDGTFRRAMEEQLRQERYIGRITEGVAVSDEEVRSFYEANRHNYLGEERIRARQIVVEDESLAQELHGHVLAGEEFAEIAREHSVVNPEGDGAIGAAEDGTEPRPVGRVALPTAVANAAFALRGPGTTEVIQSGGRYYIVEVEEYLAAEEQPFEEVEEQVREDALAAKRSAELERHLEALRAEAQIVVPEVSAYPYNDHVVARVGEREIMASELAQATYGNPQIQQFLSPESAPIISGFFKPTMLEQLIEEELAYQGARDLPVDFVGTRQQVAVSAQNYVSQDVEVSEEELTAYYEANLDQFTVSASAVATQVSFDSEEEASAFHEAVLEGVLEDEPVEEAAAEHGGEVMELGTVFPNSLRPEIDRALFETDAFEAAPGLPGQEISDVLVVTEVVQEEAEFDFEFDVEEGEVVAEAEDEEAVEAEEGEPVAEDEEAAEAEAEVAAETRERYLVLIASRSPEEVQAFDEVREQVRSIVESQQRAELRQEWLDSLREEIEVEQFYATAPAEPDLSFEPLPGELEGEFLDAGELEDDAETEDGDDAGDTEHDEGEVLDDEDDQDQ